MSPAALHSAVARRTGEDRRLISRRGFSLAVLTPPVPEPKLHLAVSCPGCDRVLAANEDDFRDTDPDDEFWLDCARCDAAYPFHADELFPTAGPAT